MSGDIDRRQEVTVTDIQMRFGSMVVFMVKWAIASIPAFVILIALGTLVGMALVGGGAALLHRSSRDLMSGPASASEPQAPSTVPTAKPEEVAYVSSVAVKNVTVGKDDLDEPGVFGEVKNAGDHALRKVEITIYCLDATGKPIFEKTYDPVLVADLNFNEDANAPLKPGYSRQFGVKMNDAPSDWAKKVDVKVTSVEFQ